MLQALCGRCRRMVEPEEFEKGSAVRLLGQIYCMDCMEKRIHNCASCSKEIQLQDYSAGRAVVLHHSRYCEVCAERAVHHSSATTRRRMKADKMPRKIVAPLEPVEAIPESPGEAEQRKSRRFIPPRDCLLIIHGSGLSGFLGGNPVRLWMDVSEGGGRALMCGAYETGADVEGEIRYAPRNLILPFQGKACHIKPSTIHKDCQMVGFRFVDPEVGLRSFLRELTSRLSELAPPKMRSDAPPNSTARPA